jgi:hypothetical protein
MAQYLLMATLLSALTTLTSAQLMSTGTSTVLSYSSFQGPQTTVSVFLYDTDPEPIYASVISADPSATTYHIECPSDFDCGWIPYANLTVSASSIWEVSLTDTEFTMSIKCTVSSGAVCQESFGGASANFPGTDVETMDAINATSIAITVTGGLDKLAAVTSTTTSASSGAKSSSGGAKQTSTATAGNSTAAHSAADERVALWIPSMLITIATILAVL